MNGRTREGFYALWTIAILICLGVCVVVLAYVSIADGPDAANVVFSDGVQQDALPAEDGQVPAEGGEALPGDGTAPAGDAVPAATPDPNAPVVLAQTEDKGIDYQSRIVFLGDSTTYGMYTYGSLPHYQVWTPASGTLSLFNWTIETIDYYAPGDSVNAQALSIADCAATRQPEYLVITLGINGISLLDEEGFKGYYSGLVQAIQQASPNTRIICNSIYPVIDAKTTDDIKNENINTANSWILDVATQTGTRYLNSHDALTDETGNLSSQYIDAESDGIHMNANGYNAVLTYVRTHAYQ